MNSFWKKDIVHWQVKNKLYVSIPFTWLVNDAISLIKKYQIEHPSKAKALQIKKFYVGGPGAILMKDRFDELAEVKINCYPFNPISYHNPFATFTTRGCPNSCKFCAVPQIEGDFIEINDFIPRPLICDNNFLASSEKHFNRVINSLKDFPYVDFNQGLEAKLFNSKIADGFCELKSIKLRFSFDTLKEEKYIVDAVKLARKKGLNNIFCYLLYGFKDTPSEALYKAELLRDLKVQIFPMRYRPLNSLKKNNYVNTDKGWTDYELKRFVGYFKDRRNWRVPFKDFDYRVTNNSLNLGILPTLQDRRKGLWDQC